MADDDYADEYPEYDEYVDDITYGLGCEYNTDFNYGLTRTASSAFGIFADQTESVATTFGFEPGGHGIGASSHARVGASLEGQPLCPGECKYDPDGKDLSYLVKKVRRKARRANLQDEAEEEGSKASELDPKPVALWGKVQSKIWQQALTEENPALRVYLGTDSDIDSIFMLTWEQDLDYPSIKEWLETHAEPEARTEKGSSMFIKSDYNYPTPWKFNTVGQTSSANTNKDYYGSPSYQPGPAPEPSLIASYHKSSPEKLSEYQPAPPPDYFHSQSTVYSIMPQPKYTAEFMKERYDWVLQLEDRHYIEHICPLRIRSVRRKHHFKKAKVNRVLAVVYPAPDFPSKRFQKLFTCRQLASVKIDKAIVGRKRKRRRMKKATSGHGEDDASYYTSPPSVVQESSVNIPLSAQSQPRSADPPSRHTTPSGPKEQFFFNVVAPNTPLSKHSVPPNQNQSAAGYYNTNQNPINSSLTQQSKLHSSRNSSGTPAFLQQQQPQSLNQYQKDQNLRVIISAEQPPNQQQDKNHGPRGQRSSGGPPQASIRNSSSPSSPTEPQQPSLSPNHYQKEQNIRVIGSGPPPTQLTDTNHGSRSQRSSGGPPQPSLHYSMRNSSSPSTPTEAQQPSQSPIHYQKEQNLRVVGSEEQKLFKLPIIPQGPQGPKSSTGPPQLSTHYSMRNSSSPLTPTEPHQPLQSPIHYQKEQNIRVIGSGPPPPQLTYTNHGSRSQRSSGGPPQPSLHYSMRNSSSPSTPTEAQQPSHSPNQNQKDLNIRVVGSEERKSSKPPIILQGPPGPRNSTGPPQPSIHYSMRNSRSSSPPINLHKTLQSPNQDQNAAVNGSVQQPPIQVPIIIQASRNSKSSDGPPQPSVHYSMRNSRSPSAFAQQRNETLTVPFAAGSHLSGKQPHGRSRSADPTLSDSSANGTEIPVLIRVKTKKVRKKKNSANV